MNFNLSDAWDWISTHTAFLAATAGSLCSAYFTETKTWRERAACFIMGVLAANFLADPIYAFLPVLGEKTTWFATGFFGLNICAAFLKPIRRFGDDADFWTLFQNFVMGLMERFGLKAKAVDAVIAATAPAVDTKEQ